MIRVLCTDIAAIEKRLYTRLYAAALEERKRRADRCVRLQDAYRCLAAGALLSFALGSTDYVVERASMGKPYIKNKEAFHYSISHSGTWVVIAYGDTEVGVDVEIRSWDLAAQNVVRRWFTQEEQDYVFASDEDAQMRFLRVWTAKESYLKYLGTGLCRPLNSFNIFSLEEDIRLNSWNLRDGAYITLCSTQEECTIEMIDAHCLA